jgi:protein TIF31
MLEPEQIVFSVLVECPHNVVVRVENVNSADTVMSIRQLLSEMPDVCYYTCYVLVLKNEDGTTTKLNDYIEITDYPGLRAGARLCMEAERYDVRKARLHVRCLRQIMVNPPIATPGSKAEPMPEKEQGEAQKKNGQSDPVVDERAKQADETSKQNAAAKQAVLAQTTLKTMQAQIPDVQIPVPVNLAAFHDASALTQSYNPNTSISASTKKTPTLPECLRSLCFSGWNPPPPPRLLKGDLFYLEVMTLDEMCLHITATINGFYINCTSHDHFDPTPAPCPHYASTLVHLLENASSTFKKRFSLLLFEQGPICKMSAIPYDSGLSLNAPGTTPPSTKQWNAPNPKSHKYDLNRSETDLLSTFGMDERGLLRDWNEEYQCCKELPQSNSKERILRARVINKITNEFVDAATEGAQAIVHGYIPCINPMDPERAYVYVYNNIFFSLAVDGRDNYKESGGDATAFTTANHDLQGVIAVDRLNIDGLHTLLTTLVDFMGQRVVAQSIIPGILQSETASTLVYGSVDNGKSIASKPEFHELMKKAGSLLRISEREVQPLGYEPEELEELRKLEVKEGKKMPTERNVEPVHVCGPVECKGILGSDGRHYVLDVVRITPRDANFVKGAEAGEAQVVAGKDKEGKEEEDEEEASFSWTLRPELVAQFVHFKAQTKRREQLQKLGAKHRADQEAAAAKAGAIAAEGGEPAKEGEGDAAAAGTAAATEDGKKEGGDTSAAPPAAAAAAEKGAADGESEEKQEDEEDEMISFNVNVFMKYKASTDEAQASKDEDLAREAADHLKNRVIRSYIQDVRRRAIVPIDGWALTESMHGNGINMRYLGMLADMAVALDAGPVKAVLPSFVPLCETEMVSRSAKHLLRALFRTDALPCEIVSKFFNCLLGSPAKDGDSDENDDHSSSNGHSAAVEAAASAKRAAKKGKKGKKGGSKSNNGNASEAVVQNKMPVEASPDLTPSKLWAQLTEEVLQHFRYSLTIWGQESAAAAAAAAAATSATAKGEDDPLVIAQALEAEAMSESATKAGKVLPKLQLLRRVCQQCGIRVASKDYDFNSASPFSAEDVIDLVPVVKHCVHEYPLEDAMRLLEAAKLHYASNNLPAAHELAQESVLLLYQVCGVVHRQLTDACSLLAMILCRLGDFQNAISQQQQVLALVYQLRGMDHIETAQAHGNLAHFLHAAQQTPLAIEHMRRCVYLLELAGGPMHDEIAGFYQKMGMMYQVR